MIRKRSALAVSSTLFLGLFGCTSSSTDFEGSVPPDVGLTCSSTTTASNAGDLTTQLKDASAGSCVVLTPGSYDGIFTVPNGVALVAQNGSRSTLTGGTARTAAVTLGEGSSLVNIDLKDTIGVAVAVRAANALVSGVTVVGAGNAALAALCVEGTTPGCATGKVSVTNVSLQTSALGLWASGAHIVMKGGSSSNHASTSLSSAAGIIAEAGAQLDLDGVTVEKNQGVGILVDGAATKASITNAMVSENSERGIWAQRVNGTLEAPAVMLKDTTVQKNKIIGVGALECRGIIIVGGSVVSTIAAPQVTNLSTTEMVGDGFGLFNTADVKLDATTVENNERAAGVIDLVDPVLLTGIIIVGGRPVSASASGLKIVVQKAGGATVQIDASDISTPPTALGVSAPSLSLPGVL